MSWIRNLLVMLVILIFSLSMLEISLRVIYPNLVENVASRNHSDPLMPRQLAGTHKHKIRNSIATFNTTGMRINVNKGKRLKHY
jgi:hypothetical protein